jgi:hypothetical protein
MRIGIDRSDRIRQCHARPSIGEYIEPYNRKRPNSDLVDQIPDDAYFATPPAIKLTATASGSCST